MTPPLAPDQRKRRPRGSGSEPTRTLRMSDALWAALLLRAGIKGVSVSEYVRELVTRDVQRARCR